MLRRLVAAGLLALAGFTVVSAESEFIRGDANTDGLRDLADAIYSLDHLFGDGPAVCRDAMDVNDDGELDVADPIYLIMYLFVGATPPAEPTSWCGVDPTSDALDCASNLTCDLGGPIEGLSDIELTAFNRGRDVMFHRFKPSEGLGPLYNATSCFSCHSTPEVGGSAPIYRNFYLVGIGEPGLQTGIPGLPSMVLPSYHDLSLERPTVPTGLPDPIVMAHRNAPPMFGTGLFEFVSNATILSKADPNDVVTPDGISGRFNTDGLGHVGRLGYKLQANFIEAFIRGALRNQMGITTDPVDGSSGTVSLSAMLQVSSSLDDPTTDTDASPDPEMSVEDLADLITFCRFLRPPTKKPFGPDEIAGEQLFDSIGCALCHVPSIASSVGTLEAYTDLLLHDMGAANADGLSMGVPQFSTITPPTTENEFRTQPLWGVSMHAPYLHDGGADTLFDAINRHGGEAEGSRQAYLALPAADQEAIIKFLEAL
ncbi:MAG: hypothetical protein KDC38_15205 [Planctomycetes bacterium]|nr:hypothetical protein [Planctomycetota bacterium]